MSLNRVFLMGRLGVDPELRFSQNQTAIGSFRIATNERRQGQDGQWTDHTEWHNIVCFGKTAENCKQYLQKGRQVFVEGKIQTRKYQDQDGKDKYFTEIVANTVQFIGAGDSRGAAGMEIDRMGGDAPPPSAPMGGGSKGSAPKASRGEAISFDDDDIPF